MTTSDDGPSGADDSLAPERGGSRTARRVVRRRVLAVCAGAGGLLAVGALAAAGLAGPSAGGDVAGVPDPRGGPAPATSLSDDPYLASLDEATQPPVTPSEGTVAPPLPEPTHRVEPPAPGEGYDEAVPGDVVAYEVPDLDDAWAAALPERLVLLGDLGQYRLEPTVPGQSCPAGDPSPVAGRQWMWAEEDSDRFDQLTVGVVVTGWPAGTGTEALVDVAQDDGACSWLGEVPAAQAVDVPSADGSWAADHDGAEQFVDASYGAARTGDLVVGVQVTGVSAAEAHRVVADVLEQAVSGLRAADPGGAAS